ncbi:unnamed protein product [Symbiodinium sp. CCMP2592]|nr:unnamed protein product [Symbiodinium sp. CCMP2592]
MAMGDNVAVEVGQAAHFRVLRDHVGSLLPCETLLYRHPIPKTDTVELLSIDDHVTLQKLPLAKISTKPELLDTAIMNGATVAYKHTGLVLNDRKKRRNLLRGTVLGAELDGIAGLVGPPRDRVLSLALLSVVLAKRGHATRELLDRIVGCWIHALTFRRPVFSVVDQLFREGLEFPRNQAFRLSSMARNELQMPGCLCSTLVCDLRATYDPNLYCLDASPYAGAICATSIGCEGISELRGYHTRLESTVSALLTEKGIAHEGDKLFGDVASTPEEFQHQARWDPLVPRPLREGLLFDAPWSGDDGCCALRSVCVSRATAGQSRLVLAMLFGTLVQLGCVLTSFCYCGFGSPFLRSTDLLHNKPWLCALARPCDCKGASHWPCEGSFDEGSLEQFRLRCCGPRLCAGDAAEGCLGYVLGSGIYSSLLHTYSGDNEPRWLQRLRDGETRDFAPRGPLDLQAGFAVSTAQKMEKSFKGFKTWLLEEVGSLPESVFASAESTAMALRGFVLHLYQTGLPRYLFVYAITAVQDAFPQHRNFLTAAWQIDKKWQRAEPGECRPVLPVAAVRAALSVALLWDWHRWAALVIIGFLAMLHPGELVLLTRRDLVFPEDTLGHTSSLFVHLRNPKTSRFARRQHGRIDDASAIAFLYSVVRHLSLDDRIYPASMHSFRRQWDAVLGRLGLPVRAADRGATPGVLRGSGATYFYMCTENIPLLAWRGRWARVKTLEYILQEVAAQMLLSELEPACRARIKLLDKAVDSLLLYFMGASQY